MNKRRAAAIALVVAVITAALAAGPLIDALKEAPQVTHYRGNVARTGVYPGPAASEPDGIKWRFETSDAVHSPTVAGGVAYAGSKDGFVLAVDLETSQELWRFETGGHVWSPAVIGGVVYAGSRDGYLYALDAESGRQIWRFMTDGEVFSSPAIMNDVVYVGTDDGDDGSLYALDAETGHERWRVKTGGRVFSPAVKGGVVFVTSLYDHIYAVDTRTGDERWRFKTSGFSSSPAVTDSLLFVATISEGGPDLRAFETHTGQQMWRLKLVEGAGLADWPPAVAEGRVFVTSWDTEVSHLHAVGARTGQERWRFNLGDRHAYWPVVVDSVVYVGTDDGNIFAVDVETGKEDWRFKSSEGAHSPTVVNGVLYVGGSNNDLYALEGGQVTSDRVAKTEEPAAALESSESVSDVSGRDSRVEGEALPTEASAKRLLETEITKISEGRIQLAGFAKTNGQRAEVHDVDIYRLEWRGSIFIDKCLWKPGTFKTREYQQLNGDFSWKKFNLKNAGWREVRGSTRKEISGVFQYEMTENGWRLSDSQLNM